MAEILSCLAFPLIAPAALLPVVLIMLVGVTVTATMTGVELALFITLLGVVGIAVEHAIVDLPNGLVAVVAFAILGWIEAEWLAPGFWRANLHPDDRERVLGSIERAIALGIDHEVRYRFQAADGRWVNLHDRAQVVTDLNGNVVSVQGMSLDVTDQVAIEKRMSSYADIADGIDLALLVLDVDAGPEQAARISTANPAAARLLNRDTTALVDASTTNRS